MEIGLQLRQAMLLNGILYNSEAWHSITEDEIKLLEKVDEHLLRQLVKGHSKSPKEFLFLEAGATPIRYLISCRRLLYLHTILHRSEEELIRRVYTAQKEDALPGDFFQLVQDDFKLIGKVFSDQYIQQSSRNSFKYEIKEKIRNSAFLYLKNLQNGHSKIRDISYPNFETQTYMTSPIFNNEEVNLLHALRSRSVNVKKNFSSKYENDMSCPLCDSTLDDQPHLLCCTVLNNRVKSTETANHKVVYEDIFADHLKQKEATHLFSKLIKIQDSLVDKNLCKVTAPSISAEMLEDSDDLHDGTVHYPSGK